MKKIIETFYVVTELLYIKGIHTTGYKTIIIIKYFKGILAVTLFSSFCILYYIQHQKYK